MPCYDLKCKKCGHEFEDVATLSEFEDKKFPKCPKCGGKTETCVKGTAAVHFVGRGFTKRSC